MWRLRSSGPWPPTWRGEGDFPDPLLKPAPVAWHPGPVVEQTRVCLDPWVARRFESALSWVHEAVEPGGRVVFNGAQVKELLRDERQVISGTRHALAVYDIATDKHAWFVQLEGSRNVGFKYDRWDAIEGVSWSAPGVLALKV
jgi:hypothetical protein